MVLSRLSEAGGRGAGGFLGGIANNPGVIIIVAIIAALVLFRGDISRAFAGFGENLGKVELPSLPQLPSLNIQFPDITFPSITFPSFEFPSFEFPSFSFPEFPSLPSLQTPQQQLELFGQILTEQQESIIETIEKTLAGGGGAEQVAEIITTEFPEATTSLFEFNPPDIVGFGVLGESLGGISETLAGQLGITPKTSFAEAISLVNLFQEGGFSAILAAAATTEPTIVVDPSISGEFIGGGPSFEGGFIFATESDGFA